MDRLPPPRRRPLAAAAALLLAGACLGPVATLRGAPSGRAGWLVYGVRDLRLEAPAAWAAEGDGHRLVLTVPDGSARLEVTVAEPGYREERACLAAADERMASAAASLERARRHPTTLSGRRAHSLEADRGGWHVWALAACDGGVQYRIFFTAASPAPADVVDVWRTLLQAARIGGEA